MSEPSGTFRTADHTPVDFDEAKQAWAIEARKELERTAHTYNAIVNYGELATEVQKNTGIETTMLVHYWIRDVLVRVSTTCHENGEPLLASLCVRQDGTIGDGYTDTLASTYGGEVPEDLELHAAEERLKCYKAFGAKIPADGGRPNFTSQVAGRRTRESRRAWAERPRPICPTCGIRMPVSEICDFCN